MVVTNVSSPECRLGFYPPTRLEVMLVLGSVRAEERNVNRGDTCDFQQEAYRYHCPIQPISSPLSQGLVMFQMV